MNEKIIFHFLFFSNFTFFFFFFSPPLEHILTWNLGEVSIPNCVWMVHYGINCPSRLCFNTKLCLDRKLPLPYVATWPAASTRRSSPSSPWRRTGGAPLSRPWTWPAASARRELLLAAMASGARRDKEAGREGEERCSQRGSRRREA